MSSPDAEVRLYDSPTDSISSLNFNSDGSRLLCSAWDSKLRLYNVDKEKFSVGGRLSGIDFCADCNGVVMSQSTS